MDCAVASPVPELAEFEVEVFPEPDFDTEFEVVELTGLEMELEFTVVAETGVGAVAETGAGLETALTDEPVETEPPPETPADPNPPEEEEPRGTNPPATPLRSFSVEGESSAGRPGFTAGSFRAKFPLLLGAELF